MKESLLASDLKNAEVEKLINGAAHCDDYDTSSPLTQLKYRVVAIETCRLLRSTLCSRVTTREGRLLLSYEYVLLAS